MNTVRQSTLKDVWQVFYPIVLMTFMGYLALFFEKVMLGYLSSELIQASVKVSFITWTFQTCGMRLASLAQVNVGRWYGARDYQKIGQGIWQFIWFSILSLGITFPLGSWIGKLYFAKTELASVALPYLHFQLIINFLYPLKMTLTGFYLGTGKIKWVTKWTVGSHVLQLLLSFSLISGIGLPSLGLMGGALSTLVSQGSLCLLFLYRFIEPENRAIFGTGVWGYKFHFLWQLIKPGIFRAVSQLLQGTAWATLSLVMISCSNLHASVLAVGVPSFYFLTCFGDALHLSIINLNTRLLGAQAFQFMPSTLKSGFKLTFLFSVSLAVPLLLLPQPIFYIFFPTIPFDTFEIRMVFGGIWALGTTYCITSMGSGLLLAFKDVKFLLISGIWSWVYEYGVAAVLGMKGLELSPLVFWPLISAGHLLGFLMLYFRMKALYTHPVSTTKGPLINNFRI